MPYIDRTSRPSYDRILEKYASKFPHAETSMVLADFCWHIGEALFGPADKTRYFLQNEFCGLLFCAASEWRRRVGGSFDAVEQLTSKPVSSLLVPELIGTLLPLMPREDHAIRAGHCNYVITKFANLLLKAKSFDGAQDIPATLLRVANFWYSTETARYEDDKIRDEGDCFQMEILSKSTET